MLLKRILPLIIILLATPFVLLAQVTTSTMSGVVKTSAKDPLVGATVTATHEPTGSVYRVQTRSGGRFDIPNMNTGGPYKIVVSFVGFTDGTRDEVYLSLGESSRQDFVLSDKSSQLTEVLVTSRRGISTGKGGTTTNIGRDKMANLPSVGRNLQDYLRFTPQAKITGDGGVAIAGQNNRYNAFYIDGAVNNDVFGLSASGTNGGQASIAPISIDAIDQFQVVISPFDASIGNFTGGGINAITRSGTNKLDGSIYYFFRNENLAGKTPGNLLKEQRIKLSSFENRTVGFRIGGPIVKNKIFFFVNAELQRDKRPQPFNISGYNGNSNRDSINKLVNFVKTRFNYDPGGFDDNPETIDADRISIKLDFALSNRHKLTISERYTRGERLNTSASSSNNVNFFNNGVTFPSVTHSASLELKSTFNRAASNRFLFTYTTVNDDRGAIGSPFPRVIIQDGAGTMTLGTENFSAANLLKQKNYTFLNVFKFNVDKSTISIGTDNELTDAYNVFIRDNFGTYTYSNLNDFLQGYRPRRYQRSYSVLDNTTGDNTAAAASFKTLRLGFFVNDEIKVNDKLTINLGVRADNTNFLTKPREDKFFNDTARAVISQFYDLQGARSGQISNPKWSISPRIGFTYKLDEENMVIRGGIGMFTGRIPLAWPGGVYNNNGVSVGGIDQNPPPNATQFRPDPNNQYVAADFGSTIRLPGGQIDLIAKKFKMPKLIRASIAFDKRFGDGWLGTFEATFSKNMNEIYYTNVNIIPPSLKSVGPDIRNVYAPTGSPARIPLRPDGSNPYAGNVFLLSNAPDRRGFAYNFTFTIDKAYRNGFAFNANYTYGNSVVVNEGTSSQNNSQWRFMETVNGRNFINRSISDFDLGHRVNAFVSKKFEYANRHLATTISFVYNGQSGNPFSYVYRNSLVNDNGTAETNDLIYVPTKAELAAMTFESLTLNGVTYTPQQQKDQFDAFIDKDKYLRKRRGQHAERNGGRLPFTHLLDLKIQQDVNIRIAGHKYQFQITYDIFNFSNMISKNWGRQYFLSNDNYLLVDFTGYVSNTNLTPKYRFRPLNGSPWGVSSSTAPGNSARWVSQLGIRFNF
jgi:outer membrane receptor for ferrienterochelin and colicin